ncbi:hypothetical protein ACFXB3_23070 [Streptomyces sp. NPDC059447]|uniref:hypothetical protein n=1 Tax=Streptomyces sp. NPDC059447 TaxID=3346834 RepID=UPI00368B3F17
MRFEEFRPDARVLLATRAGNVPATVLEVVLVSDAAAAGRVGCRLRVACDGGGPMREVVPGALSPLDPEVDVRSAGALPRLWREGTGWSFWRGGRRCMVSSAGAGWDVVEGLAAHAGGVASVLVRGRRTRGEAVAEGVVKIDARAAMRFHPQVMASMRGGQAPAGLVGEGWEVWPIGGSRYEVALSGELVGFAYRAGDGWRAGTYCVDGLTWESYRGLPHLERAVMLVREEFPFADVDD